MEQKCFPGDKNYILRKVQSGTSADLVQCTIALVRQYYQVHFNPLGLKDDFSAFLETAQEVNPDFLNTFYSVCCYVCRRLHPNNQLEILWDGSSQEEKYGKLWRDFYIQMQKDLCRDPNYVRMVVKGAFLESNALMLEKALERLILNHFNLKKNRKGYLDIAA